MDASEKELVLKVASLMEKGSEGKTQITGHYFGANENECCAMGAVYQAVGIKDSDSLALDGKNEKLGIVTWPRLGFPDSEENPFAPNDLNKAMLPDVVIFLNDRLGWSFSKIVDYLRDATLDQPVITGRKSKKR